MIATWLAVGIMAFVLTTPGSPDVQRSGTQCDYTAWMVANPQYSGVDLPIPADSLDEAPILTSWPESSEKRALGEVGGAGWAWDAVLQVVVETNGRVLEVELVELDLWRDVAVTEASRAVVLNQSAARDTLEVLLVEFVSNMGFSAGLRQGVPVRAFICPTMSAAMMPPSDFN